MDLNHTSDAGDSNLQDSEQTVWLEMLVGILSGLLILCIVIYLKNEMNNKFTRNYADDYDKAHSLFEKCLDDDELK